MTKFNDRLLKACRKEKTDKTPIWLMRQAGRYQPEYRKLRQKYSLLQICQTPELAAQVTLMPLKRFDFDAAILFSDLTIPLLAMKVSFTLKENVGPVIEKPVRNKEQIEKIKLIQAEEKLSFVLDAIKILNKELQVPLIGFAGAPFTLAAYLVEGSSSRDYRKTRAFMYSCPGLWKKLMEVLSENILRYLSAQVKAGAQALQIFDSWVGVLHPQTYKEMVFPYMKRIFERLKHLNVPVIHFGTGTASLLEEMQQAGGDVIGVDWRITLSEAWQRLDYKVAIQGNLDPAVLLANSNTLVKEVKRILQEVNDRPGHIFNLGHGILPETPEKKVERLIELVHAGI
jgi:uroporphyrinogen decarboxylase